MIGQALLDGTIVYQEVPELRNEASLPGHGDPGAGCGFPVQMHCNHCGAHWVGESSCMRRECPNCFRKWAAKEGRVAGLRAWAGSILTVGRRRRFRLLHLVVSFQPDGTDLPTQRTRAISILKKHGISGGLLVYHPFRKDKYDGKFVPDGYVHFHSVGLARDDVKPPVEAQGYVFKVIEDAREKDYRGFRRARHISQCVFYLLTHCGIVKGRHALTWYGELSYNTIPTKRLEDYAPEMFKEQKMKRQLCPICRSEDVEPDFLYDWTGGYPNAVILYPG